MKTSLRSSSFSQPSLRARALFALGAAASALCMPSTALAQATEAEAPSDNHGRVALPALTVEASKVATESSIGTRIPTSLLTTPQSITVITASEMDARGVQNLNDAVSYSAGVRPESGGMNNITETMTIRGYSVSGFGGGTNSNIYLDGLRGLSGGQWSSTAFDTFGLERVEVVKGPSAVLYGQVTPGGLVNVVSKRPSRDQAQSITVQYGSHETLQSTFDLGAATEEGGLQMRVLGLARTGNTEVDTSDDLSRIFVAPSLSLRKGATTLTLLTQYQEDSGGTTFQFLPRTGSLVAGPNGQRLSRSTFLGEPDWNNFDRTQYSLGYQLEQKLGDKITLRHNLRYLDAATEYRTVVARGTDAAANGTLARRIMFGDGDSGNVTTDLYLESRLSTGEIKHTLLTGLDYYRSDWEHTRYLYSTSSINIYAPTYAGVNQAHVTAMFASAPQLAQDATESQVGLFVQEQASWRNLNATLGVRRDTYDIDYLNKGTQAQTSVAPKATTWRAALLYKAPKGFAPYVSYSTAFDAAPYTSTDSAGKTFDDPSRSAQWEAGVKYQPEGLPALFTASVFNLRERNRLSSYKDIAANAVYNSQSGEALTRGLELESRFQLSRGLELITAYAHLDTEITKSSLSSGLETKGNKLPNVAEDSASVWLAQTINTGPLAGLSLGVGARYTGPLFDNVNNVTRLPGYTLWDASLGYDLGKRFTHLRGLSLRLSSTNLGDKLYIATANVAATAGGAAVAYYGSGRNVTMSLRYAW